MGSPGDVRSRMGSSGDVRAGMGPDGGVVIFAGPSLHGASAEQRDLLDDCDVRPPAARGDVLRALAGRPRALVVIDGYFHRLPAVTHQELLYALDGGTPVFGAASMGALRAAELGAFGMVSVGRIAAAYRDGTLDGDDEVALLHAPAEYAYAPIGVALVEVRFALAALAADLGLPAPACRALIDALKARSFAERTPAALAATADELLGAAAAACLRRRLRATSVKRDDAFEAIALARSTGGLRPKGHRAPTGYLTCFKEMALPPPGAAVPGEPEVTLLQCLATALVLHPDAAAFVASIRLRALRGAAALYGGAELGQSEIEARTAVLAAGLPDGSPWLPEREIEAEARLALLASHPAVDAGWPELARRFGCAANAEAGELLACAEEQPDLVPAWELARSFAWSPALPAARRVARAAAEVLGCWQRAPTGARIGGQRARAGARIGEQRARAGARIGGQRAPVGARIGSQRAPVGARIEETALREVAGALWRCATEDVPRLAAARGLFAAAGLGDGLREALELVAPAERLPRAINDYPEARALLCAANLARAEGAELKA